MIYKYILINIIIAISCLNIAQARAKKCNTIEIPKAPDRIRETPLRNIGYDKKYLLSHVETHKGLSPNQTDYIDEIIKKRRKGEIWLEDEKFDAKFKSKYAVDNIKKPFRLGRPTTFFPNTFNNQDIRRIIRNVRVGNYRKTETNGHYRDHQELETTYKDGTYKVVICKSDNCTDGVKMNEIITVHPICGKGIRRIPALKEAKRLIKSTPDINTNDFMKPAPCS